MTLKLSRYEFLSQGALRLSKITSDYPPPGEISFHDTSAARFSASFPTHVVQTCDAPSPGRLFTIVDPRSSSRVHVKRGSSLCLPLSFFFSSLLRLIGEARTSDALRHERCKTSAPFLGARIKRRGGEKGEKGGWRKCNEWKRSKMRLRILGRREPKVGVKAGQKVKQPGVTYKRTRYSVE